MASPLIYASLRITEAWLDAAMASINSFGGAPDNFISGCFPDQSAGGPAIEKYRALFELHNTPFK